MTQTRGLLIYGLDYGKLALLVGEKIERKPPANYTVQRLSGCLPDRKRYKLFLDGVTEGRDNPLLNWAQTNDFFREVDKDLQRSAKRHNSRFIVSLHSVAYEDWAPEDKVDFVLRPRNRNPHFSKVVNQCTSRIRPGYQHFSFDIYDEEKGYSQYDQLIVLMSHHPLCLNSICSEDVVRATTDFCNGLATRYGRHE